MDWWRQFLFRLRSSFRRGKLEAEMAEELQTHLEFGTASRRAEGLSDNEAREAAARRFGGIALIREQCRDEWAFSWWDQFRQDIRYSARSLRRSIRFSGIIVLVLALGIGANTAIFSVVRAMLLMPLPYRDSTKLVFVWLEQNGVRVTRAPLSSPDLRDLRESSRTMLDFGGIWASSTVALTGDGDPEQLRAAWVTPNFFQVLGAECALGRTFRKEDSANGAPPTILLGWDLFERRFGADPSLIGRQIRVNGRSTTVVGVMPKQFRLLLPPDASVPDRLQVWQPMPEEFGDWPRGSLYLRVIGRLRPGATLAQAREDVAAIADRITNEIGVRRAFTVVELKADEVREVKGPLLALFAGIAILLAIACVNVASLLMARAVSRARETAVRLAIGASRARLARQWLIEGLLLTLAGAAAGIWIGYVGLQVLLANVPDSLNRISTAKIDLPVLAFTAAISIAWGLLFSLAPLTELWKVDAAASLQRSFAALGRYVGPTAYRARSALVVLQISLSVVLLIGAGLLLRTFLNLQGTELGYQTDHRLTFRVALPENRYSTPQAVTSATRVLHERLAAIPGVAGVGAISHLPFDDLPNWALTYSLDKPTQKSGTLFANTRAITPGLLETLSAQLIEGRHFTYDDQNPENLVVIIDEILARRLWPESSALGREFMLGQQEPNQRATVIGVVRHLKIRSLVADTAPQIFLPYRIWQRNPMAYVLKADLSASASSDPFNVSALASLVRAAVAEFDSQLPTYDLRPMQNYVDDAQATRRFTMLLGVSFASAALMLTWVGVYGVLNYSVLYRRHEFAVRRALGADVTRIVQHIFKEGLRFALAGGALGIAGASVMVPFLEAQLYGVHSRDPLTYLVVSTIIVLGVIGASLIPARKVTTINPAEALRCE